MILQYTSQSLYYATYCISLLHSLPYDKHCCSSIILLRISLVSALCRLALLIFPDGVLYSTLYSTALISQAADSSLLWRQQQQHRSNEMTAGLCAACSTLPSACRPARTRRIRLNSIRLCRVASRRVVLCSCGPPHCQPLPLPSPQLLASNNCSYYCSTASP